MMSLMFYLFFSFFYLVNNWKNFLMILMILIISSIFFFPLSYSCVLGIFYLDDLGFNLFFLTIYLTFLMIMASKYFFKENFYGFFYNLMVFLLLIFLMVSFIIKSIFLFYFFFESSLVPMMLVVMGWGVQPERLKASLYLFFYTLFMSIPLLFMIYLMFNLNFSMTFFSLYLMSIGSTFLGVFFFLFFIMAFMVKMPMFMFHMWLPKAHVEAPVGGSMILAGIMLKLGGYGLLRFCFLLEKMFLMWGIYFYSIGLISTLFLGILCCRVNDMKMLVAYSSVVHMGLLISSFISQYVIGLKGVLVVMVSHGLISSALFMMINLYYERSSSRSLYLSKGGMLLMPVTSLFLFIFCAANFSTPPFISLMGEVLMLTGILYYSLLTLIVFPLGSFLGTVFSLYLFSYSQLGNKFKLCNVSNNFDFGDFHVLFMHLYPLVIVFLGLMFFF